MSECTHDWKEEYYGIRCSKCDLFYPDTCNWFVPYDDDVSEDWYYGDTATVTPPAAAGDKRGQP